MPQDTAQKNTMAAGLNVVVTIGMWLTGIIGTIVIGSLGLGIMALQNGGTIESSGLTVDASTGLGQLIAGLLGALVIIPAIIYVCVQLRSILATLANGDPFVPENAPRLARIALAIAATQVLRYVIAIGVGMSVDNAEVSLSFDLIAWASVAALFVLSQVFKEGTRLREEEKMTI